MASKLRISYTKLSFYLTCPKQYYFRYVEKRPYFPGISTKYGSNIHRAIKNFSDVIKDGGTIDSSVQQAIMDKQWTQITLEEGQSIAAIEAFRDCLSMNPNLPEAQLLLAKAFEKNGYYYNALDHYTAYVNLIPVYQKDYKKYSKKVAGMDKKVQKMQTSGKPIKKFTRM